MSERKIGQYVMLAMLSTATALYAHMTAKQLRRMN
jgi:hypothetical protein